MAFPLSALIRLFLQMRAPDRRRTGRFLAFGTAVGLIVAVAIFWALFHNGVILGEYGVSFWWATFFLYGTLAGVILLLW